MSTNIVIWRNLAIVLSAFVLVGSQCIARPTDLGEFFNSSDNVALASAAAEGRTEELENLMAHGADVNARGVEGMTALYWAMAHTSKPGFFWLLEHRASPNAVFARDGTSVMSLAAMSENPWFLKQALAHTGNPNFRNSVNQHTALMDAVVPVSAENGRSLIGAGADVNVVDKNGFTVLFHALSHQRYELAYYMLVAGADPTIKMGRNGSTATWIVRESRVPPSAPSYEWLLKIRVLLRQKGLDVDHVK